VLICGFAYRLINFSSCTLNSFQAIYLLVICMRCFSLESFIETRRSAVKICTSNVTRDSQTEDQIEARARS
jgi:hypothetical protein